MPAVSIERHAHVVQLYEHDGERLGLAVPFLADALAGGGAVVIAVTPPHLDALTKALGAAGVDVAAVRAAGRLRVLDADTTLDRLVDGGRFSPEAFDALVVPDVVDAATAGNALYVYGEMVTLLWLAGDLVAAMDLETRWNALQRTLPFTMLCAYPADAMGAEAAADAESVCALHSAVLTSAAPTADAAVAEFTGIPRAAADARQFVRDTLRGWGADDVVEDAALVVTELAANAIRHAGSAFTVALRRGGDVVRVAVRDGGPLVPRPRAPGWSAEGGRGLGIVAALASSWGYVPARDGKVVWAELRR